MIRKYAPTIISSAVAVLALLLAVGLVARSDQAGEQREREATEAAYLAGLAAIHDVQPGELDREGALAGGRNACHLVGAYGLDPVTLAGWDQFWHQPWEGRWLRLSVDLLCPPDS